MLPVVSYPAKKYNHISKFNENDLFNKTWLNSGDNYTPCDVSLSMKLVGELDQVILCHASVLLLHFSL